MSITDDDHELDRIVESKNLDDYELVDLPMEQPDDTSHENTVVRITPTLDMGRTVTSELPHRKGFQRYCFREFILVRDRPVFPPHPSLTTEIRIFFIAKYVNTVSAYKKYYDFDLNRKVRN